MIGEKLGPLRIESKLGAGAMGVVYRATYEPTGEVVAVKLITGENAEKASAADRFVREAEILKQFRHPNIVRHIGTGYSETRNVRYYAMELVAGPTLEQVLESRGALPWRQVVEIGIQVGDALAYAHERNVIHRDLKPSNLMVTDKGQIKLTDFGIAKDLELTALTDTGRTLGTAAYMAPEQIRGRPRVSNKTDLYALGCVLYQLLTGRPPFEGKTPMILMHKHLEEPVPHPSVVATDIPRALDRLVVALLAKEIEDRPYDAAAVAHTLRELKAKVERKEAVPLVFGPIPENPGRGGAAPGPAPSAATAPADADAATAGATVGRTRPAKARKARRREAASVPDARQRIETALLVLALAAALGLGAYLLWPPSAAYLHRKAADGMAGPGRSDWILARDRYVAELERRFPDHPYGQDVRAWKDRILLDQAKGRVRYLENPNFLAVVEPKDDAERAYLDVFRAAAERTKAKRDDEALALWRNLEATLAKDPERRGLWLLVSGRADEIGRTIATRRAAILADLTRADVLERSGNPEDAARLRLGVVRQFGAFPYLADLVASARQRLPMPAAADGDPAEPPAPAPSPAP
jgi:serine/threonine-protein kinase